MLAPVIRSFALADGGSVELHERWLEAGAAAELFILLRDQIAWKTEPIRVRGRESQHLGQRILDLAAEALRERFGHGNALAVPAQRVRIQVMRIGVTRRDVASLVRPSRCFFE